MLTINAISKAVRKFNTDNRLWTIQRLDVVKPVTIMYLTQRRGKSIMVIGRTLKVTSTASKATTVAVISSTHMSCPKRSRPNLRHSTRFSRRSQAKKPCASSNSRPCSCPTLRIGDTKWKSSTRTSCWISQTLKTS